MQAVSEMSLSYTPSVDRDDFGLTARERQVMALVIAGYTNKAVARKLGITETTAKYHLTNIIDKLEVSNRLELVLFALEQGLTQEG